MKRKRWFIKEQDNEVQRTLSHELNISPRLSQLLINREIRDADQAYRFLSPSLSHLHSPLLMQDMGKATERIVKAVLNKERIMLYGDYDVDGITSLSLLITFLKGLRANVSFYIPHRLKEGYGLNIEAVKQIQSLETKLLITADCGMTDLHEINFAQGGGMDVIITDHHEVPDVLPSAYAILNPKQPGCSFPLKSLAGVGVAFYLIIALRTKLRDIGFWRNQKIPNLKEYLDLVALGTIADIVPLTNENRVFVKFGLEQLTKSSRPGIIALKEVCGLKDATITPGMVGFRLAPRINAAGRLSRADDGVRLLITQNPREAQQLAQLFDAENKERQHIEEGIITEAKEIIEKDEKSISSKTITLASTNWHPGVIGIVASRLVEEYYKPTVIISLEGGQGKGSARSIKGFHLYEGLKSCSHLLKGFGGHKYAAGLTIDEENLAQFQRVFEEVVRTTLSEEDFIPKIDIDAHIPLKELTEEFLKEIESLSPFGPSNPEPIFCSSPLAVSDFSVVGNGHLRLKLKEDGGVFNAIGFHMAKLFPPPYEYIRTVFAPEVNEWQDIRTIQLKLKDIKAVGSS